MRVHTNNLTEADLHKALTNADVTDVELRILGKHGSQKFDRAYEVALRGRGTRHTKAPQTKITNADKEYAATYDDWGWFIAATYDLDSEARFGPYRDYDDFHAQTKHKYA